MTSFLLPWALSIAQIMLGLALVCSAFRAIRGPRAQDRVLGLDALYTTGILLLLVFGIGSGSTLYFEVALIISLLGFMASVALAKFLMRGEVIE